MGICDDFAQSLGSWLYDFMNMLCYEHVIMKTYEEYSFFIKKCYFGCVQPKRVTKKKFAKRIQYHTTDSHLPSSAGKPREVNSDWLQCDVWFQLWFLFKSIPSVIYYEILQGSN